MSDHGAFAPLCWQRMPLEGRVLIEASAGTGKTHNIGLIWLRLLLERELGVEKILVTTFTEAAAQELRERLRRRLVEFEHWLRSGEAVDAQRDDALIAHFAALRADDSKRTAALRRIQLARADFDRAPIATMHSLCLRIQRDFPFDAGVSFVASAPTDGRALLRECVEDFWRRRFLAGETQNTGIDGVLTDGPAALLRDVSELLSGNSTLVPAADPADIDLLVAKLQENAAGLAQLAEPKLFAPHKTALRTRLDKVAAIIADGNNVVERLAAVVDKVLEPASIAAQQAQGVELRDHAVIGVLQNLGRLLTQRERFARGRVIEAALEFCRAELPHRAHRRDTQTFAMLIEEMHARMLDDEGRLAARLYDAFPAALIDEFQDTDARQFDIFDRIFRHARDATRGLLVMIGDPKQAIFGFRGGDVFAYLRASAHIEHRYALLENHRSSSALVAALNAFYAADTHGFGDAGIRYRAVTAAAAADERPYTVGGNPVPAPLQFHQVCTERYPISDLERRALEDCTDRIVELLGDPARTIGGQRVDPGHIAVLLPKNVHIGNLRELLSGRGVPCVGSGRDNVLQGDTACELRVIVYAVLNAHDEYAVRGALTTGLLTASYNDLVAWQSDTAAFETELERFATWHELVRTRGVLALIDALIERYGAQWLARADGERIATDVRHLGELLADAASERHGLEGLYAWLVEMSKDAGDADLDTADRRKPRVESDARRVQIMTMHNAKGLEFPIVFLPLAWRSHGMPHPRIVKFHQAERECADAGSIAFRANRTRHFGEDLEERQRLLYVALTRAVHAVHVYWMPRDAKTKSGDEAIRQTVPLDLLVDDALRALSQQPGCEGLSRLSALPGIGVVGPYVGDRQRYRTAPPQVATRAARMPLPALRSLQRLHSFSSLTRKVQALEHETIAADEIELAAPEPEGAEDSDIRLSALQYQRGRRFGDAVHAMLEQADVAAVWPARREFIVRTLRDHGLRAGTAEDAGALEAVGRLIDRVRASDLGGGLRLNDLSAVDRVAEFEFQLPLHSVDVAALRARCAAAGFAELIPVQLSAAALHGMLTGFVDLVFAHDGRYHVLDYKTNWLGARLADYDAAALDTSMREHHYDLQALLYTVALHRYLGTRVDGYTAETHMGDSCYLFLRGVGLAPGLGVWRRRWPPGLIRAIDAAFAGVEESA